MGISVLKRLSTAAGLMVLGPLLATAGAFGHEGHHHQAMGTVRMIHESHLMLTVADDGERTFVLSEKTKYLRGKTAATKDDIETGERAVVMYETQDGADLALEVRLAEKAP
jgi:hypothetical protein